MTSRRFSRMAMPTAVRFASDKAQSKTVHLELRSGRVGKLALEQQEDLDKLFERSGAIALVEGEDQDEPVELITKLSDVKGKPVYHFAYGYDESEIYDAEDGFEEEEDEAPRR